MNLPRNIRVLIALAVVVLALAALLLVLTITEATLNIHAHIDDYPAWMRLAWWGGLALGGALTGLLLWRILRSPRSVPTASGAQPRVAPTREELDQAMQQAQDLGADTRRVRRELAELERRREAGEIHVAFFGEISTGKSRLIQALLPDLEIRSDVRGGTTREIRRYDWRSPGGDQLLISDMPGTAEVDGALDQVAAEEAQRAHIVVYVTDGDLNRQQHAAVTGLLDLGKPMLLALNKTDRYSRTELKQISQRLESLLQGRSHAGLVLVSAGGTRQVVRQLADGTEQLETRAVPPRVNDLGAALQRLIDDDPDMLAQLRDSATFVLAASQLDEALAESRRQKADALVDSYAFKAVLGALAAITPGSDLVIQGWLGTQLVRELTGLYDTKPGKVDIDLLLKLVQEHVGRSHTLILAVAGNGLKAFPGVGTLAGGALHAVAYGIIFRTLGRALTTTLATRGELHPRQTARLFEEKLGDDLEASARSLAKLVVEQGRHKQAH